MPSISCGSQLVCCDHKKNASRGKTIVNAINKKRIFSWDSKINSFIHLKEWTQRFSAVCPVKLCVNLAQIPLLLG